MLPPSTVHGRGENLITRSYTLSFSKTPEKKSVSEVNFYSHFDEDAILVVAKPEQRSCKKVQLGISTGSVVCHLRAIAQGASVKVEFTARPQLRWHDAPATAEFYLAD